MYLKVINGLFHLFVFLNLICLLIKYIKIIFPFWFRDKIFVEGKVSDYEMFTEKNVEDIEFDWYKEIVSYKFNEKEYKCRQSLESGWKPKINKKRFIVIDKSNVENAYVFPTKKDFIILLILLLLVLLYGSFFVQKIFIF